jgi:hypothetical protein
LLPPIERKKSRFGEFASQPNNLNASSSTYNKATIKRYSFLTQCEIRGDLFFPPPVNAPALTLFLLLCLTAGLFIFNG